MRIVEAASAWQASWAAQGKSDAPRFTLAKWLEREEYECEPPTAFKPKERKSKAPAQKPDPDPANDNAPTEDDVPAFMRGSPSLWPLGDFYGEFVENDVINEYGDKDMAAELVFLVNSPGEHFGKRFLHRFYVQCFIQSAQDEGRKYLSQIQNAVGVTSVEDLDDLMFKPLRVRSFGKALTYSPIKEAA